MATGDNTVELANSLTNVGVLGKGLKSPLTNDPGNGDFETVSGADNVRQCLKDLLLTRVGERVMNEDFGTRIPDALFDDRAGIIDVIPLQIVEAVQRYEPRISNVSVTAAPYQENGVLIRVTYRLRSTGRRDNLVYPLYLSPSGDQ